MTTSDERARAQTLTLKRTIRSIGPGRFIVVAATYALVAIVSVILVGIHKVPEWKRHVRYVHVRTPGFDPAIGIDYASEAVSVIWLIELWTILSVAAAVKTVSTYARLRGFGTLEVTTMFGPNIPLVGTVLMEAYLFLGGLMGLVSFMKLFLVTRCPPNDETCVWDRDVWVVAGLFTSTAILLLLTLGVGIPAVCSSFRYYVKWSRGTEEEEKGTE